MVKSKWVVNIPNAKEVAGSALIYGSGYFPRTFAYKKDAQRLVANLHGQGFKSAFFENVEQNKR